MLVEQAHDLISAHTTDERTLFLYASDAFQRILGINTQVGSACFRVALPCLGGIVSLFVLLVLLILLWWYVLRAAGSTNDQRPRQEQITSKSDKRAV